MVERRIFLPPSAGLEALAGGAEIDLEADEAHYARRVLRLGDGAPVVALDGSGRSLAATLKASGKAGAQLVAAHAAIERSPEGRATTLLMPAAKGERTDWLLEKVTEMGVARVVLVRCQRAVHADVGEARWARWQRLMRAAARQARHGRLPALARANSLQEALSGPEGAPGGRFVAHPEAGAPPLATSLGATGAAVIVLGPEGGLTPDELQHLAAHGYTRVTLGPHILRVETAALAAMAACLLVPQTNEPGARGI